MLLFGHLGLGKKLLSPFSKNLPVAPLLLGTLLPDLIDKPLYYGIQFFYGKSSEEMGSFFISGTRTFGHTAIFAILIAMIAIWKKSRPLAALSLGVASHLLLDGLSDCFLSDCLLHDVNLSTDRPPALIWPAGGVKFPVSAFHSPLEHFGKLKQPFFYCTEILGFILLISDYLKGKSNGYTEITPSPKLFRRIFRKSSEQRK